MGIDHEDTYGYNTEDEMKSADMEEENLPDTTADNNDTEENTDGSEEDLYEHHPPAMF